MAATPPICDFGWKAPDFTLPGVDGKTHSLAELKGETGTLVVFICNHCPYVIAIADRLARDARELKALGVNVIAINSNDAVNYPDDAFDKMAPFAAKYGFDFPYLHDETQAVARAYDAVCTPDFFGFDRDLGLQYRGRLDSSGKNPAGPDARRELYEAMAEVARSGTGPREQISSMGCSIKWKAA
ncbi:MAG: thioredoxin family protein [Rubrimonas sp.]|uniref:thioredoxin family protein n=1 Tax=Rubrimonas sp. TaxID=2036015 RepID=UPI002FDCBB91